MSVYVKLASNVLREGETEREREKGENGGDREKEGEITGRERYTKKDEKRECSLTEFRNTEQRARDKQTERQTDRSAGRQRDAHR